jgi:YfiH family protein
VEKNLKSVLKKLKIKSKKIILLNQTHSKKFYYVDKKFSTQDKRMEGDALITDQKNIPIAVLTADCAPILLFDKNTRTIAAIHAGWKGALKGIIANVVKFMQKKGSSSKDISATVGPCIAARNYEVKQDFIKKFIKKDKRNKIFFKRIKKKTYFSLNQYIKFQLKGLNIKNIDIINKDTFDIKNNFFSARRSNSLNENDYGRNISIIMIN